jgi:hypothetical protein
MRLYRLTNSKGSDNSIVTQVKSINTAYSYLQNLTTNDIQFYGATVGLSPTTNDPSAKGIILISAGNVPATLNTDYTKPFIVKQDSTGYYIIIAQRKYYVRSVSTVSVANNVQNNMCELYLNPQHLTPVYAKLNTEIRTRGGWEIQHWGENLTEVSVQGKTGGLQRDVTKPLNSGNRTSTDGSIVAQTLASNQSITMSTAWQKLSLLKQWYHADHSLSTAANKYKLGFNYYDSFYLGYFMNFTGPEADAESPYIMTFSFSIKVESELVIPDTGTTNTANVNVYNNISNILTSYSN